MSSKPLIKKGIVKVQAYGFRLGSKGRKQTPWYIKITKIEDDQQQKIWNFLKIIETNEHETQLQIRKTKRYYNNRHLKGYTRFYYSMKIRGIWKLTILQTFPLADPTSQSKLTSSLYFPPWWKQRLLFFSLSAPYPPIANLRKHFTLLWFTNKVYGNSLINPTSRK